MVYDNIQELGVQLLASIEKINFTEKIFSILITVVVFFICMKICDIIIGRIFNEKKENLSVQESKRILTIKKASKTFMRAGLLITEVLVIFSFFFDVGALLAVAGVGTLAIGFGAQGLVEDV
ncbi:MAG: mechanosensitive ion channel family protein, partial [Eubacterium sp.]